MHAPSFACLARSHPSIEAWIRAAALCLACLAAPAHAGLVSFDLTGSGDAHTGAGFFGDASTIWNTRSRLDAAIAIPLVDAHGAPTTIRVDYGRLGSGPNNAVFGAYRDLGVSSVETSLVTLSGLVPGARYDLVVYAAFGAPPVTVDGTTKTVVYTDDLSTLVEGMDLVVFRGVAAAGGALSFALASPGNDFFSAFQLRDALVVPEPSALALMVAALAGLVAGRRRASRGPTRA